MQKNGSDDDGDGDDDEDEGSLLSTCCMTVFTSLTSVKSNNPVWQKSLQLPFTDGKDETQRG